MDLLTRIYEHRAELNREAQAPGQARNILLLLKTLRRRPCDGQTYWLLTQELESWEWNREIMELFACRD